ncbi:MAG: hypothetical protein LBR95_03055 [Azoarcus sp.]|jgi:hypothetical protein|nr:hypothetical protein [Azoarcus sp.]
MQQGAVSIKNILLLFVVMAIVGSLPGLLGGAAKKEANLYGKEIGDTMEAVVNALNADAQNVATLSTRAHMRIKAAQKNIEQHKNIKLPKLRALALEGLGIDKETAFKLMSGLSRAALENYRTAKLPWIKKFCAYMDAPEKGVSTEVPQKFTDFCSQILAL